MTKNAKQNGFPMEIKRQGTVFTRIYRQQREKDSGDKFYVYQVADYSAGKRVMRSGETLRS